MTTPTITTTFSFVAKTKSGIFLELFASNNERGEMRIGAKSSTGYSHPDIGYFKNVKGLDCIVLNNEFINEKLIKAKMTGSVMIENFNPAEVESVKEELKRLTEVELQKQIDSLVGSDLVTLRWYGGGHGTDASLRHEKLSYDAGKKFETTVKMLEKSKLIAFENTDPWGEGGLELEAKTTWAEFKSLKQQVENTETERKNRKDAELTAKFAEAKATGKPVLISKYVVPEEESPLAKDEEGDMVDICTYAMPDGTTSKKYFHNY